MNRANQPLTGTQGKSTAHWTGVTVTTLDEAHRTSTLPGVHSRQIRWHTLISQDRLIQEEAHRWIIGNARLSAEDCRCKKWHRSLAKTSTLPWAKEVHRCPSAAKVASDRCHRTRSHPQMRAISCAWTHGETQRAAQATGCQACGSCTDMAMFKVSICENLAFLSKWQVDQWHWLHEVSGKAKGRVL